jgi:putative MATE family efflux protein
MIAGDMTTGRILRQLISFSVPLMIGALLQQLYNAFDAMVVGNYVGKEALAAVGASGPLINMIIAFAMGLFGGASALIGRFFGSRGWSELQKALHTALLLSVFMGIALSVVGIAAAPRILSAMGMPAEIVPSASSYLRIYFIGLTALSVYNCGASMLTALGDSRRPLYFLMVSTVLNIIGDLVFVLAFHWGIEGVALSTVMAEAVSAFMVVRVFRQAQGPSRLKWKSLRIDGAILKKIVAIGLPGGIQGTIVSFSNVLVQSYINGLGAVAVAGFSAAQKMDGFVGIPVQTMAMACATFVAQNLGARQVKRARQGVRHSMAIGLAISICISIMVVVFSKQALRIFTPDAEVLASGAAFMRVMTPFNFILAFALILPGALRGAGSVKFPTIAAIVSFVGVRQIYLFLVTKVNYSIAAVGLGYPFTWGLASLAIAIYYLRSDWSAFEAPPKTGAVDDESVGQSGAESKEAIASKPVYEVESEEAINEEFIEAIGEESVMDEGDGVIEDEEAQDALKIEQDEEIKEEKTD